MVFQGFCQVKQSRQQHLRTAVNCGCTKTVAGTTTKKNQPKRTDNSLATSLSSSFSDFSKHVRFDLTDNKTVAYENTQVSFEDLVQSGMWYTTDELIGMTDRAIKLTKDILQAKTQQGENRTTYISYLTMLCRVHEGYFSNKKVLNELNKAEKLQLQRLAMSQPDLIGMEQWVMHHNRQRRHQELVLAVLVVQGKGACCFASAQATEERIRQCSEDYSRPSRLVARILAESRTESSQEL